MNEQSKAKQHQAATETKPDRWIDEREAAKLTGMSSAWFQRARWAGDSIPFSKVGRAVRYKLSDVQEFMEARRVASTSTQSAKKGEVAAKPCAVSNSKGATHAKA